MKTLIALAVLIAACSASIRPKDCPKSLCKNRKDGLYPYTNPHVHYVVKEEYFVQCVSGMPYCTKCQKGLIFDAKSGRCENRKKCYGKGCRTHKRRCHGKRCFQKCNGKHCPRKFRRCHGKGCFRKCIGKRCSRKFRRRCHGKGCFQKCIGKKCH